MVRNTVFFLKIKPKGSIYNEKKRGPSIEPWGIPHYTGLEEDEQFPIMTEKIPSMKFK